MPLRDNPFFGRPLPEVRDTNFAGTLFAIEGADGSGRSTQIAQLSQWLEANGFAVRHMGLRRSNLVAEELEDAKQGNVLTHTTLSLFYATDFFDQLVHEIIPALRAGLIVLADRYIYTLMARDLVRGVDEQWLRNLYGIALVPDAVFYLEVRPENLVQRVFAKQQALDYWESGMDLGLSRDMFDSFLQYQSRMRDTFRRLQRHYGFDLIDAERPVERISADLQNKIETVLTGGVRRTAGANSEASTL